MHHPNIRKRWWAGLVLLAVLLLAACNLPQDSSTAEPTTAVAPTSEPTSPPATQAEAPTQAAEPTATEPQPTEAPAGPTFNVVGVVNRDVTQAGLNPALTVGSTTPGSPPNLWITWAENSSGGARQIFVSELVDGALQARGASLNIHVNVAADLPYITLAGENSAVPWVSWVEPSPGFNNIPNIFASRFNAASGLWQFAGQDRGSGEPSLNLRTNRPAARSAIVGGTADPAKPLAPWVAWEELAKLTNFTQIFVSKGVKDDTGIGGFIWEAVGELRQGEQPSLNVDQFRNGLRPSMVFAETGNAVPWVTWHESGADRPERVFTARGVADAKIPGGFKWVYVPSCAPDETACSLNVNPLKDAKDASMASGSVNAGEAGVPWIAWAEIGPTGKWQVFVSRLDPATRSSFVNVGGSLNVDQNHDARTPIMLFVGNTPYVAWLEDNGTGSFVVQVRHLASDPQTGTWVQDSPAGGFDQDATLSNSGLAAAATAQALFLAWVEGDPAAQASQIVIGQFTP